MFGQIYGGEPLPWEIMGISYEEWQELQNAGALQTYNEALQPDPTVQTGVPQGGQVQGGEVNYDLPPAGIKPEGDSQRFPYVERSVEELNAAGNAYKTSEEQGWVKFMTTPEEQALAKRQPQVSMEQWNAMAAQSKIDAAIAYERQGAENSIGALLEEVRQLRAKVATMGGMSGVSSGHTLLLPQQNVIQQELLRRGAQWVEAWRKANKPLLAVPDPTGLIRSRMEDGLRAYLGSGQIAAEVAKTLGRTATEVSYTQKMMYSALGSAAVMAMTGGNFPLAAAAYFGIQSLIPQGENMKRVFNGYGSEQAWIDGIPVKPFQVEIPDGLPNEIFADYRYICYDRLTAKWFPSDEIQPLNYDGGDEFRWIC